jgi:FKBP-type peptidyl-prolyl cis-trans isomerase SlyD
MRPITCLALFAAFLFGAVTVESASAEEAAEAKIAAGSQVAIEYSLKTGDGNVVDENVGRDPLRFEQGKGQILPALEEELEGLAVGDEKKVTLSPEKGYGPVNPDAYHTVPAEKIPEEARKVGAMLMAQGANGQQRPMRVHEVKGDEIVMDLNHPLAGKTLHFDIKVVSVD